MAVAPLGVTPALALAVLLAVATGVDAASDSCCAMSVETLEGMRGTNDGCPRRFLTAVVTVKKCGTCPEGTCRVGLSCYCPRNFLDSYKKRSISAPWTKCESSFGKVYPDSIKKEDVHWRSCTSDFKATDYGTNSCCSLTEEELEAGFGNNVKCPGRYETSIGTVGKCDSCPPGTCRVNARCYCPGNFWIGYSERTTSGSWADCEESFGKQYPDSVGKEDVDWRSCRPTKITKSSTSTPSGSGSGSKDPGEEGDPSEDGDPDDEGINWDKWGGIWGGVGAVAAIVFGIGACIRCSGRRQEPVAAK